MVRYYETKGLWMQGGQHSALKNFTGEPVRRLVGGYTKARRVVEVEETEKKN